MGGGPAEPNIVREPAVRWNVVSRVEVPEPTSTAPRTSIVTEPTNFVRAGDSQDERASAVRRELPVDAGRNDNGTGIAIERKLVRRAAWQDSEKLLGLPRTFQIEDVLTFSALLARNRTTSTTPPARALPGWKGIGGRRWRTQAPRGRPRSNPP